MNICKTCKHWQSNNQLIGQCTHDDMKLENLGVVSNGLGISSIDGICCIPTIEYGWDFGCVNYNSDKVEHNYYRRNSGNELEYSINGTTWYNFVLGVKVECLGAGLEIGDIVKGRHTFFITGNENLPADRIFKLCTIRDMVRGSDLKEWDKLRLDDNLKYQVRKGKIWKLTGRVVKAVNFASKPIEINLDAYYLVFYRR